MYVIVEIQGQQFKAEKDRFLYVHYLGDEVKAGQTVEFDRVLLVDNDGAVKGGAPPLKAQRLFAKLQLTKPTTAVAKQLKPLSSKATR